MSRQQELKLALSAAVAAGLALGAQRSAPAAIIPSVITGPASNIGQTTATLHDTVSPDAWTVTWSFQ